MGFIIGESSRNAFMPRKSTVSKSTTATAPKAPARKTRTRKTVTKAAPVKTVSKIRTLKPVTTKPAPVSKPVEARKVTTKTIISNEIVAKETRLVKPDAELISFASYVADIRNRWNVHNYEIQELIKDCKNGFTAVKTRFAELEIQ